MYPTARRITAVFMTFALIFSSLTFPAYADENNREPICGLQEHTHTAECFPLILTCGEQEAEPVTEAHWEFIGAFEPHIHTQKCLDAAGNPVCGYVEKVYYHKHNEYCRDENGELICGLKSVSAHKHTEECQAAEKILVCGLEENEEHQHTDACYEEITSLICGKQEYGNHQHESKCFDAAGKVICGLDEVPVFECGPENRKVTETVVSEGHQHTEACWTVSEEPACGLTEHTHTEACYAEPAENPGGQEDEPEETPAEDTETPAGTEQTDNEEDEDTTDGQETNTPSGDEDIETPAEEQPADETDETEEPGENGNNDEEPGETGNGDDTEEPGEAGDEDGTEAPGETGDGDDAEEPGEAGDEDGTEAPGETGDGDDAEEPGETGDEDGTEAPGETGDADDTEEPGETGDEDQTEDEEPGETEEDEEPGEDGNEDEAEETAEEVPLQESPMIFRGADYTVTVNFGPEAGFPARTELRVSEIRPGTALYRMYSGMTDEVLDEEWNEVSEFARFFDITFVYEGAEIEPQAAVDVQITFEEAIAVAEENALQAIHFSDEGAQLIDADTQSLDAAADDDEAVDTVSFTSDHFSVYGVVQTAQVTRNIAATNGQTYRIEVTYGRDSELPRDAELCVTEIGEDDPAYEAYRRQLAAALNADDVRIPGLFDISILVNGEKQQPSVPVNVSIELLDGIETDGELHVVHFAGDADVAPAITEDTDEQPSVPAEVISADVNENTISFEAEGFSVYAVAYTVDFHYAVNGQTYEFTLPGGGFISLKELLQALQIPTSEKIAEDAELPAEEAFDADRFVTEIETVEFSAPELVYTGRIDADTTVGALKEAEGLECEYSAELTEEEIAAINETAITAPDWALISLKPFSTNETLTITMKNGDVFTVAVTDYQLVTYVLSAGGETWEITLTYGDEAEIPEGAELVVREVLPEEEGYETYRQEAEDAVTADAIARGLIASAVNGARVFDIEIHGENGKIEPAAPVQVSIRLADDSSELLSVVHFAEEGVKTMELTEAPADTEDEEDAEGTRGTEKPETGFLEVTFETDSFSVYTVVSYDQFNPANGPYALASGIWNDKVAFNEDWGTDYFTRVVNKMSMTDEVSNHGLVGEGVHYWAEGTTGYVGGSATEWYFEQTTDGDQQTAYYIRNAAGQYLQWTSFQETTYWYDNGWHSATNTLYSGVELTTDTGARTMFRIRPTGDSDGSVYIYLSQNTNLYLHNGGSENEFAGRVYRLDELNNDSTHFGAFKFYISKISDEYDTYAALKKPASEMETGEPRYIIYRKFVDASGEEELYAVATDGSLVRVYDGGDAIYWRDTDENRGKNFFWDYWIDDTGARRISAPSGNAEHPYIFLQPDYTSGAIVSTTPDEFGLTLMGVENGEYSTAVERWDQASYDYAGLYVDPVTHELSVGTRVNGTSDQFMIAELWDDPAPEADEVATIDSEAMGIHITVFDYDDGNNHNFGDKLSVMTNVIGDGSDNYSPRYANPLVRNYLKDGMPVSSINGNRLTGLFESGDAIIYSQSGVTNLFLASYYNENGTFRYRSEDNYAYLGKDGETSFKVYRQIATPYTTDRAVGRPYYYHGHFMPFNDIDMNSSLNKLLDQYGDNELPLGDGRTYENLYGIQGDPNFYTGLKMDAGFSMPRDGILANGDQMIFKFTGDDDMWVYIDGVLILDVGGIHEPLSGTINFATGAVTNPQGSSLPQSSNIRELFERAYTNAQSYDQEEAARIRAILDDDDNWNGNTFADYTNHTFNAFYMERGAGASNLDLQFNLRVTLTDEFTVKKELPEDIDPRFANDEYHFRATFKDDKDSQNEKPLYPLARKDNGEEACYAVVYKDKKDADGKPVPVPIDTEGYFSLKAGEEAVFKMADESIMYRIQEVGIDEELNTGVYINGKEVEIVDGTADSGFSYVHRRSEVFFLNHPAVQDLEITKHITEDSAEWESDNPVFEFRVYLETEEEEPLDPDDPNSATVKKRKLVPYSYAPYYLIRREGGTTKYYTLTGENNAPVEQPGKVVCSTTGRSGSINSIPPEYTVVIPALTIGTNFYIEERRDNIPEGYEYVTEELTDGTYDVSTMGATAEDIQRTLARDENDLQEFDPHTVGAIKKGVNAESHIYNRKLKEDITIRVEKAWEGITANDPALANASVTVKIGRYLLTAKSGNFRIEKNVSPEGAELITKFMISGTDISEEPRTFGPYIIYGSGEATGTLPPGSYTVTETIVTQDESYEWTHSAHTASLTIADGADGTPTPVSFTSEGSVRTGSLKIVSSMDAGGSSMNFATVYYTVLDASGNRAKDADGNEIEDIYFPSHEAANTGRMISNLKTGNYTIVENNVPPTPEGYVLYEHTPPGTDRMTVTVTENGTANAYFNTTYRPTIVYVTNNFRAGKYHSGNWQDDAYEGSDAMNHYGNFTAPLGSEVDFILYLNNGGWNRFTGTNGTDYLARYNGQLIQATHTDMGNNVARVTFRIPQIVDGGYLEIGCNAQENAWRGEWDVQPVNGGVTSNAARRTAGGRTLTGIQRNGAGTAGEVRPAGYGTTPSTGDNDLYKYVLDATYTETVTLNAANGWAASFTGRPVKEVDDEGVSYTYYYFIKEVIETGMPEGTTCAVKLDGEGQFLVSEDNNTSAALGVTNMVPRGSIVITKQVLRNGTADPDATGTFRFAVYGEPYETNNSQTALATGIIELTAENQGTNSVTVGGLLYGSYYVYELDDEGTPITSASDRYYVSSAVYTVNGSGTSTAVSSTTSSVTVSNIPVTVTTEISGTKTWIDNGRTHDNGAEITLSLQRKTADTNWADVANAPTPTWEGNTYTFADLPAYADNLDPNTAYEYRVLETAVSVTENGQTVVYLQETDADGNDFINTELTNINATKTWKDGEENVNAEITNSSVTFTLQRLTGENWTDVPETAELENPKTLTVGNTADADAWIAEWNNLPAYEKTGETVTQIKYRVVESEVILYGNDITPETPPTAEAVNNTANIDNPVPKTEISASKQWKNASGTVIDAPEGAEVVFELLADGESMTPGRTLTLSGTDATEEGTVVPDADDYEGADWTAFFTNLPVYNTDGTTIVYTVKESSGFEGFALMTAETGDGGTIVNQQNAELNLVKVDKNNTETLLEGAEFEIFRYAPPAAEGGNASWNKVGDNVYTTDENGSLTFSGLYPGYYRIKEKTAPAGYMYTGDGSFYVKVDETGLHLLTKGTGADPSQWSAAEGETAGDVLSFTAEQDGNSWTATVGNPAGVVLPSTGGTGTGVYTGAGLALILLAGALMLTRRRYGRR